MALFKNQSWLKITSTVDTFKISNCFFVFLTFDVQMLILYYIIQLFIINRSFFVAGGGAALHSFVLVIYSLNKLQLGSMSTIWDSSLTAF